MVAGVNQSSPIRTNQFAGKGPTGAKETTESCLGGDCSKGKNEKTELTESLRDLADAIRNPGSEKSGGGGEKSSPLAGKSNDFVEGFKTGIKLAKEGGGPGGGPGGGDPMNSFKGGGIPSLT